MAAPSKRVQARTLDALAFFSDPERVKLLPGADVTALVGKYARMRDVPPEPPKAGPSTAASIRAEWETVPCDDPACEMPGSCGRTYAEWHAEGLRQGYRRGTSHTHTRPITPCSVRCANCYGIVPLASWWNHGCAGRGTA